MTKLTRKLFVSIMTLVLTVMALGTSTFAWFSMNTTATATGMQVTAKSNATYLLIGASDSIATTKTGLTDTVAATADGGNVAAVYPSYFNKTAEAAFPGTLATGATAPTTAADTWYTASNKNSNDADDAVTNIHAISSGDLGNYVLTYTTYLTLSADSEDYSGVLKFTSTLVSGDAAASMVVKVNNEYVKLVNGTQNATTSSVSITKSTALLVTIYVYIDGTSTNVYSDYINQPQTITGQLSVQFDLDV